MLGTVLLCCAGFMFTVESFQLRPEVTNWLKKDQPVQAFFAEQVPVNRIIQNKMWIAWTCTTCGVGLLIQGRAAAKG